MDFKVKCVRYIQDGGEYFTVGKIYDVVDGVLTCDYGVEYTSWAQPSYGNGDFKALCKWFSGYWEFELVEEKKVFTKNNLKNGMFGVMSNDLGYFVVVNGCLIYQNDGFERIDLLTDDMCASYAHIERVYEGCTSFRNLESNERGISTNATLVYDRERDPEKLYNGKIVCVDLNGSNGGKYTVGKIYQFVDGKTTDDRGNCTPYYNKIHSFEEWEKYSYSKFIEIKE